MKKKSIFAAMALVALASCTSDENISIVSPPETSPDVSKAIVFSSESKGVTRANQYGADAAALLHEHFTVGGFKVDADENANTVFDNYVVKWNSNSAGTTESNTSDWEYVGEAVAKPSTLYKDGTTVNQTIKYWDFSTSYYDFIAYSTGEAGANGNPVSVGLGSDEVRVIAIDYANKGTKAYTIGGSRLNLAKCYIADMVTVKKADYQKEVQLTFRSLASKVRMGIYETVPGYSVKDVKFYTSDSNNDADIATGGTEDEANLFASGTTASDYFYNFGTFTIYFPTTGSANESSPDYNQAHASFSPVAGEMTTQRFGPLTYTSAEGQEAAGNYYLGRSLHDASYAKDKDYEIMLPNDVGTVLELRIDYTLVATDGSGEEIKIHGAKAFVPAIYTTWKPNYAYTYIFKISDNTNGWSSTVATDPAGLYPITFDAAVVDPLEGKQSTITTVAMPSITTYQFGHDVSKDEYDTSGNIYIQVMNNGTTATAPRTDIGSKGHLYAITKTADSKAEMTEANVMDALNIPSSDAAGPIVGRNGLTLTGTDLYYANTIPGVDGNDLVEGTDYPQYSAVRFTPESGKTYAFCYEVEDKADSFIYSYVAASESDLAEDGTWFEDPDGATPYNGTYSATKKYYKKYVNKNTVWGVKVIKVE